MLRFDDTGQPGRWGTNAPLGRTAIPETRLGGSQLRRVAPDEAAAGRRLEGDERRAGSEPNCRVIRACRDGAVIRQ